MSAWKAKRFWKSARTEPCAGGFAVRLDDRLVKTPAKRPLVLPTLAMAQAIAAEWDAQQGPVRPETMPVTRAANSALDKVVPQFDEIVDLLAAYGGTDLICYRATRPAGLIARQATAWDPLVDWSAADLLAPVRVTSGIIPVAQDPASLATLRGLVAALTPFQLAAFHDLVSISGSLILALATTRGHLSPDAAWALSRIDECWQAEEWGEDEDATAQAERKQRDFLAACAFWAMSAPNC